MDGGTAGSGGAGDAGTPLVCPSATTPANASYAVDATGVTFTLNPGRLRLQVCKDDIIRVEYTSAPLSRPRRRCRSTPPGATPSFCVTEAAGVLTITTARMKAKVDTSHGHRQLHRLERQRRSCPKTARASPRRPSRASAPTRLQTAFNSPADEALFGLGQHQDSVINRKGTTLHMLNVEHARSISRCSSRTRATASSGTTTRRRTFAGNVSEQHPVQLQLRSRRSGRLLLLLRPQHRPGDRDLPDGHRPGAAVSQVGLRPLPVEGPLPELSRV